MANPPRLNGAAAPRIRPFRSGDAPALAQLFHAAVHEIAGRHYSEAQVRAWSPAPPAAERILGWAGDGRLLFVAADAADTPVAFADVEPDGHVDHLFCRPDLTRSGVASGLYDALEAAAREQGLRRLHVEASEPAMRFFARKGFTLLHRRDFAIDDVPIHNYAMEKRLEPVAAGD